MNFFFSHKKYRSIFTISTDTSGLIDFIKNTKTYELQKGAKEKCSLKYKINTMDYFGNVLELVQLKRVTAIK